ncbi:hypothetical protein MTO96_031605 [Rhipicephalus appendiculatus]
MVREDARADGPEGEKEKEGKVHGRDDALSATPPKEQGHDKSSKDRRRSQMHSSPSLFPSLFLEIHPLNGDMRAHLMYMRTNRHVGERSCDREVKHRASHGVAGFATVFRRILPVYKEKCRKDLWLVLRRRPSKQERMAI